MIGLLNNARVTSYQEEEGDVEEVRETELIGPSGNRLRLKKVEWNVNKIENRHGPSGKESHKIDKGFYCLNASVVGSDGNVIEGTACEVLKCKFNKVIGSFSNEVARTVKTTAVKMNFHNSKNSPLKNICNALGLCHANQYELACVMLSLNEMSHAPSKCDFNWMKEIEHFEYLEDLHSCKQITKCSLTADGIEKSMDAVKIWAIHNYNSLG